jgi:hypothetical protein
METKRSGLAGAAFCAAICFGAPVKAGDDVAPIESFGRKLAEIITKAVKASRRQRRKVTVRPRPAVLPLQG